MEYHIQPNTRHCAVSGREIKPGERFYSVLLERDHQFFRQDYSDDAWKGPPEGTFSFWMGRLQDSKDRRPPPIDDDLLLDCFHRLEGQTEPHQLNFRYVVTLLLMRRKLFRFEDARPAKGRETLVVRSVRDRKTYEVVNPRLTEEEILAVQDEVFKVLGWT
jgi:hypothetical protein